jgi:hypothetical protein
MLFSCTCAPSTPSTVRGVEDPHGLIDLLLMRGTILRHVEQRGV